jgi:hypothetical protein
LGLTSQLAVHTHHSERVQGISLVSLINKNYLDALRVVVRLRVRTSRQDKVAQGAARERLAERSLASTTSLPPSTSARTKPP